MSAFVFIKCAKGNGDHSYLATLGRCPLCVELDRVKRMEIALRSIQQWDCLNPPRTDLLNDLGWLKGLVDDALDASGEVK